MYIHLFLASLVWGRENKSVKWKPGLICNIAVFYWRNKTHSPTLPAHAGHVSFQSLGALHLHCFYTGTCFCQAYYRYHQSWFNYLRFGEISLWIFLDSKLIRVKFKHKLTESKLCALFCYMMSPGCYGIERYANCSFWWKYWIVTVLFNLNGLKGTDIKLDSLHKIFINKCWTWFYCTSKACRVKWLLYFSSLISISLQPIWLWIDLCCIFVLDFCSVPQHEPC